MRAVWPSASKAWGTPLTSLKQLRAREVMSGSAVAPESAFRGFGDDGLINLNRGEATSQGVAFRDHDVMRLVPFGAGGFQSRLDDLVDFARLELAFFQKFLLFFGELTHGVRVNAFKAFQLIRKAMLLVRNSSCLDFSTTPSASSVQAPSRSTYRDCSSAGISSLVLNLYFSAIKR